MIKFILEETGMRVWLDNESAGTLTAGMDIVPVRVLVAGEDADRARDEIKRSEQDETTTD